MRKKDPPPLYLELEPAEHAFFTEAARLDGVTMTEWANHVLRCAAVTAVNVSGNQADLVEPSHWFINTPRGF